MNYELCYAMGAVVQYLCEIRGGTADAAINRTHLQAAYDQIAAHEADLLKPLLAFLQHHPAVRIIGEPGSDVEKRVATLSFVHLHKDSQNIVEAVDPHRIGIRFGDFYAVKLIDHLGLREQHGVVRISMAHYNTEEEVSQLIKVLSQVL